jgi:hypothetical protein
VDVTTLSVWHGSQEVKSDDVGDDRGN